MKLYKEPDGGLIIGGTEITSNTMLIATWSENDTKVAISPIGSTSLYSGLISELVDSNNNPYADKAALKEVLKPFFFRVGGGSSKIATYTGDDENKDFAVPSDFVSALFVLNPYSVPFTIVTIGSLKYVHFTEAPVTGDFPQLVYVS